jgi:hypothetical protein
VVVDNLDPLRPLVRPDEAHPHLIVDADAVLAGSVARQLLELPGGDLKKSSVAALSSICNFRSAAALMFANLFDFPVSNSARVSTQFKDWIAIATTYTFTGKR